MSGGGNLKTFLLLTLWLSLLLHIWYIIKEGSQCEASLPSIHVQLSDKTERKIFMRDLSSFVGYFSKKKFEFLIVELGKNAVPSENKRWGSRQMEKKTLVCSISKQWMGSSSITPRNDSTSTTHTQENSTQFFQANMIIQWRHTFMKTQRLRKVKQKQPRN